MIKKGLLVLAAALVALSVSAQNVQETTVNIGILTAPAYTVSLDKDVKVVQDAVNQRLKDMKLKTKKSEGYIAALDQVCPEITTTPVSLYTKVEEQGKKKDKVTVVTVCAISSDLTIDQTALRNSVRQFVESMVPYMNRYDAMQKMEAEQENLKKAEKAAASAASVVTGLEKDIASAQKKIEDKKSEIEKLKGKISDLQNDIKSLESEIEKNKGKKSDAQQKSSEAQQNVKAAEQEVERWRQLAQ